MTLTPTPPLVPAQRPLATEDVARAGGADLEHLPGRTLLPEELRTLAASVAARPELWQQHARHDGAERHFHSLHRDANVDVWVLSWVPGNDTGWHDHDISSGAVAVVAGTVTEHNLAVGSPSVESDVVAGQVFCFGPEHIHRLTGKDPRSVSIHAYSPPLWRMGQYALGPGGVLRRVSVSYADELRPLDDIV